MALIDPDALLMVRYCAGDAAAFTTLYARHKGPLYRYLLRQVRSAGAAADLFQEVWSHLIAARIRYEPRAKFVTFLFHIAHNCCIDFRRRAARSPSAGGAAEHEARVPEHQHPDHEAESGEQHSALLAAVHALPREQGEAFLLYAESGLSIEEIAHVTGVPVETAKSRLRYAVRKLKHSLLPARAPALALRPGAL